MYLEALAGIKRKLISKTNKGLTYVAELIGGGKSPKMVGPRAFVPSRACSSLPDLPDGGGGAGPSGVLPARADCAWRLSRLASRRPAAGQGMLTAPRGGQRGEGWLAAAAAANTCAWYAGWQDLTYTCYQMYARQPAKLAPEIAHFDDGKAGEKRGAKARTACNGPWPTRSRHGGAARSTPVAGERDLYVKPADAHNLLRPETVESLFILWRVTKVRHHLDGG
jgi:mannosyl-oligosaccharide alpha-1,2-mannosidase